MNCLQRHFDDIYWWIISSQPGPPLKAIVFKNDIGSSVIARSEATKQPAFNLDDIFFCGPAAEYRYIQIASRQSSIT